MASHYVEEFLRQLADDKEVPEFTHEDLKAFQTHSAAPAAAGGSAKGAATAGKGCRTKCAIEFALCRLSHGKNCGDKLKDCILGCLGG